MVKRITLLFALLAVVAIGTANAQWNFVKNFPDNTTSFSTGLNNTVAVDPTGKVWIAPYTGNYDSVLVGGVETYCWKLFVYNPDGTLAHAYGPILNNAGTPDTLYTAASGYGSATDPDGNIIIIKNSYTLRRINYQTGEEMNKVTFPIPGYSSSMGSPGIDAAGEIFMVPVAPTTGVGPVALSSDFSSVLISVDTSTYGSYSRNIMCTADGNDVYVGRIATGVFHYHSDNGTLGPYVFVDTLFKDLVVETGAWQPKTNYLYVGSGNVTSGLPNPPFRGYAWYGYDMANPDAPVLKDSILWNGVYDTLLVSDPRPRGIAFSPSGDTAYVAAFNANPGFCEMFKSAATAVHGPSNTPATYTLSQNYPNPFNPSTKIDYTLKTNVTVTLRVYDMLGRVVATLVNEKQSKGDHSVTFNADRLSSGVYIYSLATSDGFKMVKKMLLLK